VEEVLKKLAVAMETADKPGLDRVEVQRLKVEALLCKTYNEQLSKYLNYREIECKLIEMEKKYDELLKEKGKDDASKPVSSQVPKT